METTLITLAQFHFDLGFIGYDEYDERIHIALWLANNTDANDPRLDDKVESDQDESERNEDHNEPVVSRPTKSSSTSTTDGENNLEFLCLGIWVFTKADRDSYPSIPHGHYRDQNRPWPKLNPYTGRVFTAKHQEDKSQRLSKKDMKKIWGDESFKSFCREMIIWYQEQFPYYEFLVRRPLRMPRW